MTTKIKRDFGSFHASNVQDLLALNEEDYIAPNLPISTEEFTKGLEKFQFGKQCRLEHFLLEDTSVFLNHGAFGAVLKRALDQAQVWQRCIEKQPLRFFDRELLPLLAYVTRRLAKFVGSDPEDVVLVTNATTAINSVVRSLDIQRGDTVYMLSCTYGAVKKILTWMCYQTGATLQEESIPDFPLKSKEQIVSVVRDTLKSGTKLAVFDHVPSNTPFILPLEEIIEICHQRNVPVLIDGAHALGMLPLNLNSLNPDFYVSNAHKWFCCPKGSAFLYVKKKFQKTIRPLIISHGFGSGFNSEFIWAGLHDYSPFLVMPSLIDFWETVGVDKILQQTHWLCKSAGNLLITKWGTKLAAPPEMFGSMALVELPQALQHLDSSYNNAEEIQNILYHNYNIEVPIKAVQGKLYVRISAHIYNELSEYETLANAVLDIAGDGGPRKKIKK